MFPQHRPQLRETRPVTHDVPQWHGSGKGRRQERERGVDSRPQEAAAATGGLIWVLYSKADKETGVPGDANSDNERAATNGETDAQDSAEGS